MLGWEEKWGEREGKARKREREEGIDGGGEGEREGEREHYCNKFWESSGGGGRGGLFELEYQSLICKITLNYEDE